MTKPPPSLIKRLEEISHSSHHGPHEVFRAFCLFSACALAAGSREDEYLAEAKRWPEHMPKFADAFAQLVEEMERLEFTDILGPIHMEWGSMKSHQRGGEFYTPPAVSQMIARMTITEGFLEEHPIIRMGEPACGSGGMILAAAEVIHGLGHSVQRLRVTATDVSSLAVHMCFINTTLWGIPAKVIHGNALSLETWSVWRNPIWYSVGAQFEEDFEKIVALLSEPPAGAKAAPEAQPVAPASARATQLSFEFEVVA